MIKGFFKEIRSIPAIILTIFCLTIVIMNVLANKTIFQNEFIALDGGIVITWVVILLNDLVTTVYGPRKTICMAIFGTFVSLVTSLIFYLVSIIPSSGQFEEFSKFIGGTWFIVVSGAIAFILSSSLNAVLNVTIGRAFKKNPNSKLALLVRNDLSTLVSQIFDNFVFNCLAFMVFAPLFWNGFKWTPVQCICCALVYGAIELFIETILFPLFHKIYRFLKSK